MIRKDILVQVRGYEKLMYAYGDTRAEVEKRADEMCEELRQQGYIILTPINDFSNKILTTGF